MKRFFTCFILLSFIFTVPVHAEQYTEPVIENRWFDGMYVGFALSRTISTFGGMTADYRNMPDAWMTPGSLTRSSFDKNSSRLQQLSVGKIINENIRIDISHVRQSGISVPTKFIGGGQVSNNAIMLNVYYNINHFTGNLLDGMLRPYVGMGIGVSRNRISDYWFATNFWPDLYWSSGIVPGQVYPEGTLLGIGAVSGTHSGSNYSLVFALEAGTTANLTSRLELDLFIRLISFGRIRTDGLTAGRAEVRSDGINPASSWIGGVEEWVEIHYSDRRESGLLDIFDIGARLRYMF